VSQDRVRSLLHLSLALQNFNKLFYCDSYFACFCPRMGFYEFVQLASV